MMQWICFNGQYFNSQQPAVSVQNRGYKWGDGVFETMKVTNGVLQLADYHFERLFFSLDLLSMKHHHIQKTEIAEHILTLCNKNNCISSARVRLAVYRGEDNEAGYSIEATTLDKSYGLYNEIGLTIGIYPFARKSVDGFSNLKSANYLPYVMAGMYAKEQNWDDALLLNSDNHICDSTRANIFLIKGNDVYTPALNQGCVNGVMRRHMIELLESEKHNLHQHTISEEDLLEADEIFLTNALIGIKWVGCFKNKQYSNEFSKALFSRL